MKIVPPSRPSSPNRKSRSVGRRPKTPDSQDTAPVILDAAEKLFSLHGYHGVTVRAVAVECGVDSSLVHYYFGTKQELFDAVFARRAELINKARLDAMARYEQEFGEHMTVEGVAAAFLMPLLDRVLHSDPNWKNYFALVGLVNTTRNWGAQTMTKHFDPVVRRFIELLQRVLPQAQLEDLFWSYHFLTGALTLTLADTGRLDRLSEGRCRSSDMDSIAPRMIEYAAAGFRAVCRPKDQRA
ncbi:MAG: TetR/AcrR family transcriptional regulator [Telluria sp.]